MSRETCSQKSPSIPRTHRTRQTCPEYSIQTDREYRPILMTVNNYPNSHSRTHTQHTAARSYARSTHRNAESYRLSSQLSSQLSFLEARDDSTTRARGERDEAAHVGTQPPSSAAWSNSDVLWRLMRPPTLVQCHDIVAPRNAPLFDFTDSQLQTAVSRHCQ